MLNIFSRKAHRLTEEEFKKEFKKLGLRLMMITELDFSPIWRLMRAKTQV